MEEIQILNLLTKYSIDCIFVSLLTSTLLLLLRDKTPKNVSAKKLFPLTLTFIVYFILAILKVISFDEILQKSFCAGGLSTVIYAFFGGYNFTKDEELKQLLLSILKSVVTEETLVKVTDDIITNLCNENDENLITVKISDLIRANLADDCDEDKIKFYSKIFVNAFKNLKNKS